MKFGIEQKTALIHVGLGSIVGFTSNLIGGGLTSVLVVVIFLAVSSQLSSRLIPTLYPEVDYTKKWWLSNALYPFISFWLFTWVLIFNI
ncbi:TPA: DUF5379 family protein [archaeon]|nr:DUF5379 family protein [Candidatus Undinarchaeales archaeon SRR5007147.bin71]